MIADHPIFSSGGKNPVDPPLHLHFDQTETFKVVQGAYGVTTGYDLKETILTSDSPPFDVLPMMPHRPWSVSGRTGRGEDTVMLLVIHPKPTQQPLESVFFTTLFKHLSDAYEQKKSPDMLMLMHAQHQTASTNVMFPTVSILGPLRWWLPWKLQAGVAVLAGWLGYKPLGVLESKDL